MTDSGDLAIVARTERVVIRPWRPDEADRFYDLYRREDAAGALLERGFAGGLDEVWAVTHLDNNRSIGVCHRIGMRLLGITHRWYHAQLLMFWSGARAGQEPSLAPDEPAP